MHEVVYTCTFHNSLLSVVICCLRDDLFFMGERRNYA